MSQRKAHFFNLRDSNSSIALFASFKLSFDTHRIHEEAAMRVLSSFDKNALVSTLNSRMSAATNIPHAAASVHLAERFGQNKLFHTYAEVVNNHFEKFSNDWRSLKWPPKFCAILNRPARLQFSMPLTSTRNQAKSQMFTTSLLWATLLLKTSIYPSAMVLRRMGLEPAGRSH